ESEDVQEVTPGFHGLSNHLLDTPWPKVTRGVAALRSLGERFRDVQDTDALVESLLRELRDDRSPAAAEPPRRSRDAAVYENGGAAAGPGLGPDPRESIFVRTADYGTRASTVLCLGADGVVRFAEQCWDASGARLSRRDFQWDSRINSDTSNQYSL
ncbi:MAG: NRDE family protein, partial [Planctomycetaceae bacterium]